MGLPDFDIEDPESINSKAISTWVKNDAILFDYRLKNYLFMSELDIDSKYKS